MFGKIIKDVNFDRALNSSTRYNVQSANYLHEIANNHDSGHLTMLKDEVLKCDVKNILLTDNWIGYDESILEYNTIEGSFKAVSYVLVTALGSQYLPAIYLDLSFVSRHCSNDDLFPIYLNSQEKNVFEKHFHLKKIQFIESLQIKNKIFLMDGPLFSGVNTQFNFRKDNENINVHFVKNSSSSIILDFFNIKEFNNDLHWAMKHLRPLERSALFQFTSDDGRKKTFAYLKITNKHSPIRIEISAEHSDLFVNSQFWNTICHQYLAAGLGSNNQPRLIQIAEKYARESLINSKVINYLSLKDFIPTTNEMRF